MADDAEHADEKKPSALVAHASALEVELARFEALVGEAGRLELISEPTPQHARQVLEDCAASERRMAD